MAFDPARSITVPIVMGVATVALSIALLIGWILVIVRNVELTQRVWANSWLMGGGVVSFAVIMAVLVLFSVFLTREIRQTQRQVRFIDSVTHELKSPLASLRLMVETLARRDLDRDRQREMLRMMLDDIDRLGAFIDDILEASRIRHGRSDLAVSRVVLKELADRAARHVRTRYQLEDAEVTVRVVPPTMELNTESTGLEVVLRNLLDNAVKYSDRPAVVRLDATIIGGNRVSIEVVDRGIGIPSEHLAHVFERFYRVPEENVAARRGTGLGLYVASALVRNLGGQLQVSSAGPGAGTTMRFELAGPPAAQERTP
jgi:signal transduction histidine kinase